MRPEAPMGYAAGVSKRDKIEEVLKDVLRPLLEKDGGGIQFVRLDGSKLTLRLSGQLLGCPGTGYVKKGVIEPAIHAAAGKDVEIVYESAPVA
jgi:Fe-S cluster biogenesis protein NfuA